VSYVFSGLGGAAEDAVDNRLNEVNYQIANLKELRFRAPSSQEREGVDSQIFDLEDERRDLLAEKQRLAAIDADHAARAKERDAFHAEQSADIAARTAPPAQGEAGLSWLVSSIKNAFGMGPSSPAPTSTTSTTTYASKSASDSSGVISALQSQRNVALQQAAALPPGPAQQQQLQIAAGAEQQIKDNGGTPDSTYVAAARAAQSPTYQSAPATAPQAVSMPSAPKGPSAIMQMALASQQRQQAIPSRSLFDSLGPVQLYNQTSTAAKIGVGVVAVGGLSLALYLAFRPKK
jgi:hypothetical protein